MWPVPGLFWVHIVFLYKYPRGTSNLRKSSPLAFRFARSVEMNINVTPESLQLLATLLSAEKVSTGVQMGYVSLIRQDLSSFRNWVGPQGQSSWQDRDAQRSTPPFQLFLPCPKFRTGVLDDQSAAHPSKVFLFSRGTQLEVDLKVLYLHGMTIGWETTKRDTIFHPQKGQHG